MAVTIRQIADELNYQPNYLAKSLRSGKTQTIGLIIADISNPFFANIARIVEDEAKRNGYTVIIGSSDEDAGKSEDLLNVLLNRQVDGFIIVSSENTEEQIRYLNSRNVQFVLLDRYFPHIPTDYVALNNHKAAYEAASHLIQGGYSNVGLIAYRSGLFHMQERIRGYLDSLRTNEIRFQPEWVTEVEFNRIEPEIRAGIDAMLASDRAVNALIFATYRLAISGLRYINELGLNVPNDLAMEELGKTAVGLLIGKLNSIPEAPKQILMEATLIIRDSSKLRTLVS